MSFGYHRDAGWCYLGTKLVSFGYQPMFFGSRRDVLMVPSGYRRLLHRHPLRKVASSMSIWAVACEIDFIPYDVVNMSFKGEQPNCD